MVTESDSNKRGNSLKFLCSYAGKILPRSTDGKLRYIGGLTRVLAVDSSVSFTELMVKLSEFCGFPVTMRCQLPNGDLETLISVKSDDDLVNVVEEYDRVGSGSQMIRAVLSHPKSNKQISPPSSVDQLSPKSPFSTVLSTPPSALHSRFLRRTQSPPPHSYSVGVYRRSPAARYYDCRVQGNSRPLYHQAPPRFCNNWQ